MIKDDFMRALKLNDIEALKKIPKSDLHNHATRGGNIKYIMSDTDEILNSLPSKFKDLHEMQEWYNKKIKPYCRGRKGLIKRIEAAFLQAKDDGVTKLVLSFGVDDKVHFNNELKEYVKCIGMLKEKIIPNVDFSPEICFVRTDNIVPVAKAFDEIISLDFFKSVDLVGDEAIPINNYEGIYKKAKKYGFILKAHVGEFGTAKSVMDAVNILQLDQVQHGIAAAESKEVMDFLSRKQVQLNICPTSNVILSRVENYNNHPISKLYKHGIPVTINTDDMLIFNQSVSEEYMNLYNSGALTAEQLNEIREIGLGKL
ncbi:adenosine deaminase [Mycoplasmatota bacterium WC44]